MANSEELRSQIALIREHLERTRPALPPEQVDEVERALDHLQALEDKLDDPPDSGGSSNVKERGVMLIKCVIRHWSDGNLESMLGDLQDLL